MKQVCIAALVVAVLFALSADAFRGAEHQLPLHLLSREAGDAVARVVKAHHKQLAHTAAGAVPPPSPAVDFGSYVTVCTGSTENVTFVNFPKSNCQGKATLYTLPIFKCYPESYQGMQLSWTGTCNATTMEYLNFNGLGCKGESICTRPYTTFSCQNCPNAECKTSAGNC